MLFNAYWACRIILTLKISSKLLFIHSKQTKTAFTQEPRIWLFSPPLWQTWSIRDHGEGKVRHHDVAFRCSQPWEHQSCATKGIKIIRNSVSINGASDVKASTGMWGFQQDWNTNTARHQWQEKKQHPETTLEHFCSFGPPQLFISPLSAFL